MLLEKLDLQKWLVAKSSCGKRCGIDFLPKTGEEVFIGVEYELLRILESYTMSCKFSGNVIQSNARYLFQVSFFNNVSEIMEINRWNLDQIVIVLFLILILTSYKSQITLLKPKYTDLESFS